MFKRLLENNSIGFLEEVSEWFLSELLGGNSGGKCGHFLQEFYTDSRRNLWSAHGRTLHDKLFWETLEALSVGS